MNKLTGDPLAPSYGLPSKFLCNLQRWLQDGVGIKCTNNGDCLRHGVQNDWFSCGVVLPNTIAHNVFGDQIWIPRRAVLDRVNWFLKLVKGVADKEDVNNRKVSSYLNGNE
jgi:hypothetical protein